MKKNEKKLKRVALISKVLIFLLLPHCMGTIMNRLNPGRKKTLTLYPSFLNDKQYQYHPELKKCSVLKINHIDLSPNSTIWTSTPYHAKLLPHVTHLNNFRYRNTPIRTFLIKKILFDIFYPHFLTSKLLLGLLYFVSITHEIYFSSSVTIYIGINL